MMNPGLDNLAAHPHDEGFRPFLSSCSDFLLGWLCPHMSLLPFQDGCCVSRHVQTAGRRRETVCSLSSFFF